MCSQLIHIFPIGVKHKEDSTGKLCPHSYTIRGRELPGTARELMDWIGKEKEEEMSVGLGHVAHLCLLLARYLHIPLRHPIIYRGSRSFIVDCFIEAETYASQREGKKAKWNPKYPLFSKDSERARFKRGIDLLSQDISGLCTQCKIKDHKSHNFIHNIRNVLYMMALTRF